MKHSIKAHVMVALGAFALASVALSTTSPPPTEWTDCSKNCASAQDCNRCCQPCLSFDLSSYNNCIGCCALQSNQDPNDNCKPAKKPVPVVLD